MPGAGPMWSMAVWWVAGGAAVFALLLLTAAVTLAARRRDDGDRDRVPPARVLAERLAHGEIDEDEYRRRIAALREDT